MSVKRLATLIVAVVMLGGLIPATVLAAKPAPSTNNGACPSSTAAYLPADNVGAFWNGAATRTYTFVSLVDESPSGGVPGLVGYCVYTNEVPTSLTTPVNNWTATILKGSKNFVFARSGGNKNNIPLDGTATDVGTAWFSNSPTSQTILLHINDASECTALYGPGSASTCWVLPTTGPLCSVGSGATGVAYNDIPFGAVNCGPPSHAFEATQTKEFGDEVVLGADGTLESLTVLFNSYACQDSALWNNQFCSSPNPPGTFTHPITANVYEANADHTVGALLDTVTVTQTIPFRPSADTTNCGTTGAWFNTITQGCEFSAKVLLTFNFTGGKTLASGDHVIWTVAFATSTNGLTPTDSSQCSVNAGCPYDSLNVGTKTYDNAPYAGGFADDHAAFINSIWNGIYCDDGAGGTGSLRVSTNPPTPCTNTEATNNYSADAWLGYKPLGQIVVQ